MSEALPSFEGLLHEALSPIEPPEDLVRRLEGALTSLTESAAEELEAWELSAMRDPRNWVRPAAAVVVGGGAGVALVLLARPAPSTFGCEPLAGCSPNALSVLWAISASKRGACSASASDTRATLVPRTQAPLDTASVSRAEVLMPSGQVPTIGGHARFCFAL